MRYDKLVIPAQAAPHGSPEGDATRRTLINWRIGRGCIEETHELPVSMEIICARVSEQVTLLLVLMLIGASRVSVADLFSIFEEL